MSGAEEEIVLYEIVLRDPQSILQKQLGQELIVTSYDAESFLKSGDNYGSTILKVRLTIKRNADAKEEELNIIAKMLPPTERYRQIFETSITFKKEVFFYEDLIPTYRSLYNGVCNITPKFYGSRLSLCADTNEVDSDGVIFMENLKIKGYYMGNRHKGLDLDHLKAALTALAKFHTIGLSIKHKKPSYLPTLKTYADPLNIDEETSIIILLQVLDTLKKDREVAHYYDRAKATGNIDQIRKIFKTLEPEDPWACMVHSDSWLNNILFHRDAAGNVDDAKLLDFQMSYLSSPLTDLVFILCTSMEKGYSQFDEMLQFYKEEAIKFLQELGCDTSLFSNEQFEERLKIDAANELYHITMMTKVMQLREGENIVTSSANVDCQLRMKQIIQIYADKNWF